MSGNVPLVSLSTESSFEFECKTTSYCDSRYMPCVGGAAAKPALKDIEKICNRQRLWMLTSFWCSGWEAEDWMMGSVWPELTASQCEQDFALSLNDYSLICRCHRHGWQLVLKFLPKPNWYFGDDKEMTSHIPSLMQLCGYWPCGAWTNEYPSQLGLKCSLHPCFPSELSYSIGRGVEIVRLKESI